MQTGPVREKRVRDAFTMWLDSLVIVGNFSFNVYNRFDTDTPHLGLKRYDVSGDGFLDISELRNAMGKMFLFNQDCLQTG